MSELIDDLLAFSRLNRQPLSKRPVASAELVRQALVELHNEQEGRRLDIRIGELPVCRADPSLLKQVFINLLANALKFTRHREVAVIEIGCQEDDGTPATLSRTTALVSIGAMHTSSLPCSSACTAPRTMRALAWTWP